MAVLNRRNEERCEQWVETLSVRINSAPFILMANQSAGIPEVFPGRRLLPRTMLQPARFSEDDIVLASVAMEPVDESLDVW